jgi:hypothetical protein
MTWRSLGDSNPCFRRERDAEASLGVHTRPQNRLINLENRSYLCMIVFGHSCPYIGHLLDTKDGAQNSRREA